MMMQLNVVTYNVNGLNHVVKRKKILTQLKQMECDIALLQESHLSDFEHKKLKREWVGHTFFSSHPSSKRNGVCILINKRLSFTLQNKVTDSEGRFIVINCVISGTVFTIANIYAPNNDSPQFIDKCFLEIGKYTRTQTVIGGDFNCTLSPAFDKSQTGPTLQMSKAIKYYCREQGLVDIWRKLHPSTRDYTFFSNRHKAYSRIDFFLVSLDLIGQVKDCKINSITISDHSPVNLIVNPLNQGWATWTTKRAIFFSPHHQRASARALVVQWLERRTYPLAERSHRVRSRPL